MKRREDSFFGLHLDLHPVLEDRVIGADITEENIREFLEAVNPDYVTYDCKGHLGIAGYDTKVGAPVPNMQKDSLTVFCAPEFSNSAL